MKVEIWSDVMCPFCYIGKRKFEDALSRFPDKDRVEVVWKSFQLDPSIKTNLSLSLTEHLAASKGWSIEQTRQIQSQVVNMAAEVGLNFDFDRAVVANSFDAHRFIQLAKTQGLGDAAEEELFRAYFSEGKNTADHETLVQIGIKIGLVEHEIRQVLESDAFASEVQQDIYEARQIGLRGVPHFVFNDRYSVSGAQHPDTFLGALNKAFAEWKQTHTPTDLSADSGASCSVDGVCE